MAITSNRKKRAPASNHASPTSPGNADENGTHFSSIDGDLLELHLAQCARTLYGQSTGVIERLCQEIADASQGRVQLRLQRHQPAPAMPFPETTMFSLLIQLGKRMYGGLEIGPDPAQSDRPALPLQQAQRIALHCAFILSTLEAAAYFQREYPAPVNRAVSLTARELEVLNLLCRRFTRKEIAENLHIAPGTVGKYCETIYKQLGVRSEREVVVAAFDLGLYSPVEHLSAAIDLPSMKKEA